MDIQTFIDNYQETFSGKAELPIAFWYSDTLSGELRKTQGCLFKALPAIRNGEIISMSGESIGCGGGKFYTGFTPMPEHVPNFVSLKERYKQTPEMVLEGIKKIDVQRATKQYIHFARIDRLTSFEDVEGLLFLATPDILSGLVTWAFFDNNSPEAISTPPSARPYVESNVLSFTIPMSRFKEMCETMRMCSLDTHAWGKIKARIDEG